MTLVASACGATVDAQLRSEAASPADLEPPTTVAATVVETSARPITEAERQAGEDSQAGIDASAAGRLTQGAAAVDPDAQGTIVAHVITDEISAYELPDTSAPLVETFDNPTEHGGPLVFAAKARPVDGWLEVMLPIRPNGSTGWIQADKVDLTINPYRIEINASEYLLTVYRYGRELMSTIVAIGNGDTPTPIGEFYLIELLRPSNPDGAYGPFAYGLSGYSETLESFNGGDGVIGIHGTNRADQLGQDVSHGCIRVANPTITEMTQFLPLGTPVVIFRNA